MTPRFIRHLTLAGWDDRVEATLQDVVKIRHRPANVCGHPNSLQIRSQGEC